MNGDKAGFIRANTAIMTPPHVPEIRLHIADEAHDLWHKTEEELAQIGLPPPFWAFAWAGGQGLARYVLDNPVCVQNRQVLDFATGSGLVAIAAALAGAKSVTAADIDPFCETAVTLNAALNGVDIDCEGHDLVGSPLPQFETVLAGDVFFDREMSSLLIPWFSTLADSGMEILIGDPGRAYLPRENLTLLANYAVPVTRALEDAEVKRTCVWRFGATARPAA